jgi:hypothetical protein
MGDDKAGANEKYAPYTYTNNLLTVVHTNAPPKYRLLSPFPFENLWVIFHGDVLFG